MKYNAKKMKSGQFAVFQGAKYWERTVTDSEAVAKNEAIRMSVQWHLSQAVKCIDNLDLGGCNVDLILKEIGTSARDSVGDACHQLLEGLGCIDDNDPHGYMA